jgi:hypothetical protein
MFDIPDGFKAKDQLEIPRHCSVATQCELAGLVPGDVIIGREGAASANNGRGTVGWWHESELTLVWIGQTNAVFSERIRTNKSPEWDYVGERTDWTLDRRDWFKVPKVVKPLPVHEFIARQKTDVAVDALISDALYSTGCRSMASSSEQDAQKKRIKNELGDLVVRLVNANRYQSESDNQDSDSLPAETVKGSAKNH